MQDEYSEYYNSLSQSPFLNRTIKDVQEEIFIDDETTYLTGCRTYYNKDPDCGLSREQIEKGSIFLYKGRKLHYPDVGLRFSDLLYQGIATSSALNHAMKRMKLENYAAFIGASIPDFFSFGDRLFFDPPTPRLPELNVPDKFYLTSADDVFTIEKPKPYPYPIFHMPVKNWAINFIEDNYFVFNRFDACGYVGMDYLGMEDSLQKESVKRLSCLPIADDIMMYNFDPTLYKCYEQKNYHIIRFRSYVSMIYVQMTQRDIYELAHANPEFNDLISFYATGKFHYVEYDKLIRFDPKWNGFIFWTSLFYDYPYSKMCVPRDNFYMRQAVYDLFYGERIPKTSNIEIQGLFELFVTGKSEPSIFESVKQIGRLAETANNVKDSYDKFLNYSWVQEIIQSITSLTSYFSQLFSDFAEFSKSPLAYCQKIQSGFYDNLKMPEFGLFDNMKVGITFVLSFYLYSKSKLISLGLFMYAMNGTLRQCMTDSRIVRNSTILATLCFIGLMQATQPTSASIQIQSYTSFQAMVFTVVSFITLGVASKGSNASQLSIINYLSKNTQSLFNLTKGTLSLMKCVEFVLDAFNTALNFVFGDSIFYKTMVKMTVTSKDLQEYITYSMLTSAETLAAKLTMDNKAKEEWTRMCVLHNDFVKFFSSGRPPTESHIGYSMYSKAFASFNKLKEEYDKIRDSLTYFRVEPFMIWIWGEPGTGKTYIRDQVINNVYRWHKKLDPTIPDIKVTGLTYVRNPADKYMSKYNGQFAVAYDDVGQNRQSDNPEFNEIMGFGSTNQVRINMADLADKGKMFSSKLVVMAANSKDVESNNLILKDEAFNRRRHIVLKVERPTADSTNLSTSKCDFTRVALIITDPRNGGTMKRFPDSGFGENDATWVAFYTWLGPLYKQHVISQNEALKKKEEELRAIIDDESHPNIVDLVDIPPVSDIDVQFGDFGVNVALDFTNGPFEVQGDSWFSADNPLDDPFVGTRPTHCDTIFKKISYLRFLNYEFDTVAACVLDVVPYGDEDPTSCPSWILFKEHCKKRFGRAPTPREIEILKSLRDPKYLHEEEISSINEYFDLFTALTPSWVKFCSLIGVGGALYGTWRVISSFFKEEELFDLQSYSLNTKAPPTHGVHIQNYSLNTKAPPTKGVQIQSQVPNLTEFYQEPKNPMQEVANIYKKSLARFSHLLCENITFQHVNGINVGMSAWLLPNHFVLDVEEFDVLIKRQGQQPARVTITRNNIRQIENTDLCLIHIPQLNHGRNIINHFATREQLAAFRYFNASVLSWHNDTPTITPVGRASRWDTPLEVNYLDHVLYYPQGYNYNWQSIKGDCGSILMSNDNSCTSKLMGVHFGYDMSCKVAKSVIISRELLQQYVDLLIPPVDMIIEQDPEVEIQGCPIPETLLKDGKPIFEHFGYVKDGPVAPHVHKDLFRSPLFDVVYPHEKDLSVLNKNDKRMEEQYRGDPDILTRGVIDFAYDSQPWPVLELKLAQEALKSELDKFSEVIPREVCSQDWAINGSWVDGQRLEFTEALNLKTSAGYGLAGKKLRHFETKEFQVGKFTQVRHSISNAKLQSMVDDQWNDWMEGKTHPTIWAHALKSEPVKLSKIVNGNTRTFCVAQTALLINVRRLFGAFTVAMKNSKIKSFSCLGMDSFSGDWNHLYNELRSKGTSGIDMDFFKYDRTAVTWQLARAVVEVINRWYNDDVKYQRARIIAFEDMIFSYALINKHLTRKVRGNPSGNPLTTELNNCINYMMLVMVYLIIAKVFKPECYSVSSFQQNISVKTYGDDILFSVHPLCQQWFQPKMIEETYKFYGVPVTPADKSDKGLQYQPIDKLTFLKCEFLPFNHPIYKYQAGLSKTSIRNMIQFYRLQEGNGTIEEACRTNCEDSLRFAYHWGKEFFDDHKERINKRFKELNWPSLVNSYEEYDFAYRTKLA